MPTGPDEVFDLFEPTTVRRNTLADTVLRNLPPVPRLPTRSVATGPSTAYDTKITPLKDNVHGPFKGPGRHHMQSAISIGSSTNEKKSWSNDTGLTHIHGIGSFTRRESSPGRSTGPNFGP